MISIPGYKITKTIGRGGMATVYLATQESIGRKVAIKIMSPALAADPSFSDRFVKEARMANLSHPNIVTVYDAGEIDGTNYIVMEYASGGNLDTLIKQGISVSRCVEVIKQIASALHYSCNKGFIHRDVKPENIIFREDGSAVLMDFGIAKAISSGTQLTMVGSTIGSPNYMSPEQARGLELDGRSDLYSLGIVFYEALTGTKPYDASDTYVIGLKHINDPIPQLPGNLSQFQAIIDRLLAKSPDGRFDNGNQLIQALEKINLEGKTLNNNVTDIDPNFQTKETHVNVAHDAKTYNVSTIIDDSTHTLSENTSSQAIPDNSESDKTQILPEKTALKNDETRILPNDDNTQIMPSKEGSEIDKTIAINAQPKAVSANNKTGLYVLILFVLAAGGGGAYWYLSQKQKPLPVIAETPKVNVPKKEPSEQERATLVKPETPSLSNAEQIQTLLSKAQHAMAKKRFTSPKDDNAFSYYSEILNLDPTNTDAQNGLNKIAERYLNLATKRYESQELSKAMDFIDKGLNVVPEHTELMALKHKIQKQQPPTIAKKTIKTQKKSKPFQSLLLKDLTISEVKGIHISQNSEDSKWFARQDIIEGLYNRMLSQCNASDTFFNRKECLGIYNNFLKQWPLPLNGVSLKFSKVKNSSKTQINFNKQNFAQAYKKRLKALSNIFKNQSNSEQDKILALYNYANYQSITSILGVQTQEIDHSKIEKYLSSKQKSNDKIRSTSDLADFVSKFVDDQKTFLAPIISDNSLEVTPYASAIYKSLPSTVKQPQSSAKKYLFIDYSLRQDGDVTANLWLFNNENELVSLDRVLLDSALLSDKRKSSQLFDNDIHPQQRLRSSYGFSASIAMDKQTNSPRLLVGNTTSLNIKMAQPGFYFIAVHVVHIDDQYSYLLPLSQAEIPFVQIITREQTNQFNTLGSFKITPPTGVEVLQLVASSINLEKYLPDNHWDAKRQQFVIDGSEGNISRGINEVRNYMNTLPKVSHDKSVKWQERLLVTSILDE